MVSDYNALSQCCSAALVPWHRSISAAVHILPFWEVTWSSSFLGLAYKAAGGWSMLDRDTFLSLAWLRPRIPKVGVLPFFSSFFPYGWRYSLFVLKNLSLENPRNLRRGGPPVGTKLSKLSNLIGTTSRWWLVVNMWTTMWCVIMTGSSRWSVRPAWGTKGNVMAPSPWRSFAGWGNRSGRFVLRLVMSNAGWRGCAEPWLKPRRLCWR